MTYQHKMTALPPQYDTAATEKKWQAHWREKKTYAWDSKETRENSYVIDTPPPTVSGLLHMGHVFSYTQADIIARFQRMTGKNVFYPMGFDDNGLPTERLVEKTKKIRATDMPREEFIAQCLSVSEEARAEFRALFESIALSVDWDQEYHTISDASRRLSQLSFLDLVKNDHVYRKLQPMLWDPVDQTAIAQAEVVDKELPSNFLDIQFTCKETGEPLIIGTTRPELLTACVALFFHPEDARYKKLKGKTATVPLFGFDVPILEDDSVEQEKGTGLMMCCTFGDEADIAKWNKHKLPTRVILNKYAKLDFSGLDVQIPAELIEKLKNKKTSNVDPKNLGAREIITADLEAAGLLKEKKPITHAVKCAERSGAVLELIPSYQWFVRVTDKKDALKAKAAECNWNPEWMKVRMDQWIDGLNWDWCISRQRYFGVPFPVWYARKSDGWEFSGEEIKIFAKPSELPTNPLSKVPSSFAIKSSVTMSDSSKPLEEQERMIQELRAHFCEALEDIIIDGKIVFAKGETVFIRPDMDVMDTWATSSISPQLSAHGITKDSAKDTSRFNALFPADLRPQAHEIIRTWAFYTLVKAYLHNHTIPWKNLMISGWCLAEDKTKMSKSKGNVVTPVDLINEKGTDAVRYWTATSRLGQDTAFSPDLLKIGKKLVNKLCNATQFAAIHLNKMTDAPKTPATDAAITETLDRWILSRLGETVEKSTKAFGTYEYAVALEETNQFFWADFCDNYLELIKKRVYNEPAPSPSTGEGRGEGDYPFTQAQQQSAVRALYYCLNTLLKLYAPFMPHVTEELFSHIFASEYATKGSLHARYTWPKMENFSIDVDILKEGAQALEVLTAIRNMKSTSNVSIKFPVAMLRVGKQHTNAKNWMVDVAGAGNVRSWEMAEETSVTLADEADAA
jgi:valyl-tRNA synthetase